MLLLISCRDFNVYWSLSFHPCSCCRVLLCEALAAESRLSAACCNHQSPDGMLAEQQLFITQLGIQAEHIGLQNLELKFGNNDLDYGTRHQHKIWEGKFLIKALVARAIEAGKVKDLRVLASVGSTWMRPCWGIFPEHLCIHFQTHDYFISWVVR